MAAGGGGRTQRPSSAARAAMYMEIDSASWLPEFEDLVLQGKIALEGGVGFVLGRCCSLQVRLGRGKLSLQYGPTPLTCSTD